MEFLSPAYVYPTMLPLIVIVIVIVIGFPVVELHLKSKLLSAKLRLTKTMTT